MIYILCDHFTNRNVQGVLVPELQKRLPNAKTIVGMFDDEHFTSHFEESKAELFLKFCKAFQPTRDVVLLFTDFTFQQFPLYYSFLQRHHCNIRMSAFLHGGFYEPWDLQRTLPTYAEIERGQLAYLDRIFVQTHYHSRLLTQSYPEVFPKIRVVGLPLHVDPQPPCTKNGLAYFSRPTPDKGIDIAQRMGAIIESLPDKAKYWQKLSQYKAVLVPTRKETFGYVAIEAILCGTIPIVPYKFCYPEIFGDDGIYYESEEMLPTVIKNVLNLHDSSYEQYVEALQKRISHLQFTFTEGDL